MNTATIIEKFKTVFFDSIKGYNIFFDDIKSLKDSYKRITSFDNLIKITDDFYILKLFPKEFPNLTVDLRIRIMTKSNQNSKLESENVVAKKFSEYLKEAEDKFVLGYFVYPGMYSSEIEENSFIFIPEKNKIYGIDRLIKGLENIQQLIDGNKYINSVDIGTFDLFTFAEYYPSPLVLNTQKYVHIKLAYTPDILSFRRTDLPYNIDKIIDRLLMATSESEREAIVNELKDIIRLITKKIVLIYSDILFKELVTNGRTLNITTPPHLENDIRRSTRILIENYSRKEDVHLNKNINVARFYIDKFMSYYFINSVYKTLKSYLTNSKALFTVTYDINYFVFWNDLKFLMSTDFSNHNNDINNSDDVLITAKCYDSLNIVNPKTGAIKCIHRQVFDSIKFLMNRKLKDIIRTVIFEDMTTKSCDPEEDYRSYRYSHKFIKIKYLPIPTHDVIKAYYDILKYFSSVEK
jgi:hypothetical protein